MKTLKRSSTNAALNKASKSDLRKLSSFLQKRRKKAVISLRQFLTALSVLPMMKEIPTDEDWADYDPEFALDLDVNYARGQFFEKSNTEMHSQYKDHVLMRAEDLHWMPRKPFQYYVFGFRDFVRGGDFGFYENSDAASSFLGLILQKLQEQPDHILPIISELMEDVQYIAANQQIYEADADIYGDFMDVYNEILRLAKHT